MTIQNPTPNIRNPSLGPWMALSAALLGWMFDGAEMGLFSMVGRKAIQDLMGPQTESARIDFLFGVVIAVFLVGAATGGVVFGWLGDRIGRVRAMSLSIVTYALFTGLCGLVNDPVQLAILRFIASLGMGGEWSLGVALVMEVWPNRSRALMAGLIGAAANAGYLLVGVIGKGMTAIIDFVHQTLLAWNWSEETVNWLVAKEFGGWRLLMLLGTVPALLTFFIRLFVPESEKWQHEKERGATSHWATRDLMGVLLGALGPGLIILCWAKSDWFAHLPPDQQTTPLIALRVAGTLLGLAIATVGYTWPVAQFIRRSMAASSSQPFILRRMLLAACLSGVALLGTWGSVQWAAAWAGKLTEDKGAAPTTQIVLSVGAIIGTIAAALAGGYFGRRRTYFVLCVTSLASALLLFQTNTQYDNRFLVCCFIAGITTAAFYGWLPLYLPELFGTSVRATCQGFSFNYGRILAAIGALQTGVLFQLPNQEWMGHTFRGGHPLACSVMSLVYIVGMVLIWFAPETKGQPLPE